MLCFWVCAVSNTGAPLELGRVASSSIGSAGWRVQGAGCEANAGWCVLGADSEAKDCMTQGVCIHKQAARAFGMHIETQSARA